MSNELPEKPNVLQRLMARFRNAAKGFRGGYKDEIDSLRNKVASYEQEEQAVREMRQGAEARADELSRWEIKIREENYNVEGNKRANEERAEELSNYSNALNKRAQEIEIEATERAHILLNEYKKDLSEREKALSDKEDAVEEALRQRKAALSAKENAAEEALRQREAALSAKEDAAEAALRQRGEALSNKEARVNGLERLLKDDKILPENEDPQKTATRLAFISRMQDLQGQLDDLDSICSELNGVPDKEVAEDIKRSRNKILGRFLALITMDEITKRTK